MPCRDVSVLVLAILAAALGACSESYDLQGPPAKSGRKFRSTTALTIQGGTFSAQEGDHFVTGVAEASGASDHTWEVLQTKDGRVTRARQTITRETFNFRFSVGEQTQEEPGVSSLTGWTVLHTRTDSGAWTRYLVDPTKGPAALGGAPVAATPAQAAELRDLPPPTDPADLYPRGKVRVGHTWLIEGPALAKCLGTPGDIRGSATMVLEKVDTSGVHPVAHIKVVLQASVLSVDDGGQPMEMQISGVGSETLDLTSGLTTASSLSGTATYRLTSPGESGPVLVTISGPLVISGREEVPFTLPIASSAKKDDSKRWGRFAPIAKLGDWIRPGFGSTLVVLVIAAFFWNTTGRSMWDAIRKWRKKPS